jgi:hypothetical protein
MKILFDYLVGRQKTEDGRIPDLNFFEIFLKLFRPSGKKADIQIEFQEIVQMGRLPMLIFGI